MPRADGLIQKIKWKPKREETCQNKKNAKHYKTCRSPGILLVLAVLIHLGINQPHLVSINHHVQKMFSLECLKFNFPLHTPVLQIPSEKVFRLQKNNSKCVWSCGIRDHQDCSDHVGLSEWVEPTNLSRPRTMGRTFPQFESTVPRPFQGTAVMHVHSDVLGEFLRTRSPHMTWCVSLCRAPIPKSLSIYLSMYIYIYMCMTLISIYLFIEMYR